MNRYLIDAQPVTEEEARRHRGACNAALSSLAGETWENELEADVAYTAAKATDYADAMIREYRRRCEARA